MVSKYHEKEIEVKTIKLWCFGGVDQCRLCSGSSAPFDGDLAVHGLTFFVIGIYYSLSIVGPGVGFLLAGYFLTFYTTLHTP